MELCWSILQASHMSLVTCEHSVTHKEHCAPLKHYHPSALLIMSNQWLLTREYFYNGSSGPTNRTANLTVINRTHRYAYESVCLCECVRAQRVQYL